MTISTAESHPSDIADSPKVVPPRRRRPTCRTRADRAPRTRILGQKPWSETMASARSLYDVLNVSHDAEGVVIEAAYRALMKKYHPDQAAGDAASGTMSAAEINQAFAILRDPKRRAGYDLHERNEWSRNQPVHISEPAYQPPPRRSGFAWTGWLVALLLGAILYAVLNGRGGLIVPPQPGNDSASAELDHRTQPVKIAPALDAATAPTAIDREIMLSDAKAAELRRGQVAIEEAADAAAEADVLHRPRTGAGAGGIAPARAPTRPHARRDLAHRPRRRAQPRGRGFSQARGLYLLGRLSAERLSGAGDRGPGRLWPVPWAESGFRPSPARPGR